MKLMDEITTASLDLYKAAADTLFIKEMGEGTLSKEKFYSYIVQDSIYLRDYMKSFAAAMFKSRSLKEMQFFYSILSFVEDSENETRLNYLKDAGLTDDDVEKIEKKKACKDYTEFLITTAINGSLEEILMAVMPCMTGYEYVFRTLKERYPEVLDTYYGPLVRDYTHPAYSESCRVWEDYCSKTCENYPDKEKLKRIFREASQHELSFWKMAGGEL